MDSINMRSCLLVTSVRYVSSSPLWVPIAIFNVTLLLTSSIDTIFWVMMVIVGISVILLTFSTWLVLINVCRAWWFLHIRIEVVSMLIFYSSVCLCFSSLGGCYGCYGCCGCYGFWLWLYALIFDKNYELVVSRYFLGSCYLV